MTKLVILGVCFVLMCTGALSFLWLPLIAGALYWRWLAAIGVYKLLTSGYTINRKL